MIKQSIRLKQKMERTESKDSVTLDIQNELDTILLNSFKAKLEMPNIKKPSLASGCCIYRVPPKLRKVNQEAYNPIVVSIGPFHHRDTRLESRRDFKLWYLHKFLQRTEKDLLEDYVKELRVREAEIRQCYSQTIQMESHEFVRMILTDAFFIIELFLESIDPLEENPLLEKNPWPTWYMLVDLILLENQLPFFVLECLFDLTFPSGFSTPFTDGISFVQIAFMFFKTELLFHIIPVPTNEIHWKFTFFEQNFIKRSYRGGDPLQVLHLNDMLRMFYLPSQLPKRGLFVGRVKPICSASQLREAGIRFKVSKHKCITKVQYSDGVLKIPYFRVTDWTETMIRNVVAFEQCHYPVESYVTDYIVLWDHLINTEKDVEMLVEKGIIQNFLTDNNAVAHLVNRLSRNVIPTSFNVDYIFLFENLNEFCDNRYHRYKAIFKHEYLRTPWKIASFGAAILLLFLTLIQTICSVIALFQR